MRIPEGFLWGSMEEFERDLASVVEKMKQDGIRKGILVPQPDGTLKGRGSPDKWFDAVEED